jgi:methylmalonyl-CoA mutase cobalamin-binding domain/chain
MALVKVDRIKAREIFVELSEGREEFEVLEEMVVSSLERIGDDWEKGNASLSQVYMSGVICEELIDKFIPSMEIKRKSNPRMAIAVLQDHHGLGKRIVYSVLRAGGYELLDFGIGVSVDKMIELAIENDIEVLLISTLMLPAALRVKEVKKGLEDRGFDAKIIVGGAPFRLDENLWKRVDADACARNASEILAIIKEVAKS